MQHGNDQRYWLRDSINTLGADLEGSIEGVDCKKIIISKM